LGTRETGRKFAFPVEVGGLRRAAKPDIRYFLFAIRDMVTRHINMTI